MSEEEKIQQSLIKKFDFLRDKISIPRQRRIFACVELGSFEDLLSYSVKDMGFEILCTITGLDEGENLGFIYHLARQDGIILNIKTTVPKAAPVLKTITKYFANSEIYERELVDLLGAKVEGLPEGTRYPLPDDWPKGQFPLRKDWKPGIAPKKEEI